MSLVSDCNFAITSGGIEFAHKLGFPGYHGCSTCLGFPRNGAGILTLKNRCVLGWASIASQCSQRSKSTQFEHLYRTPRIGCVLQELQVTPRCMYPSLFALSSAI